MIRISKAACARQVVTAATWVFVSSAWAAAPCMVSSADFTLLKVDPGSAQQLAKHFMQISPCAGSNADAVKSAWVLYLDSSSKTNRRELKPGQSLRDLLQGVELREVTPPSSTREVVLKTLKLSPSERPAFSQFDSRSGIPLAGRVLPGSDLLLPLELYGWSATQPVVMTRGGVTKQLPVERGMVRVPRATLPAGPLTLKQGDKSAELEVLERTHPDVIEVELELKSIDGRLTDASEAQLARFLWLSEMGFEADAVHSYFSR